MAITTPTEPVEPKLIAVVASGGGSQLEVLRAAGTVTMTDGGRGQTLSVEATSALVGLLDQALAEEAPAGLIGSVETTTGRHSGVRLDVGRRWSANRTTDDPGRSASARRSRRLRRS